MRLAPLFRRGHHQTAERIEQSLEVGVRQVGHSAPRVKRCRKASLALEDVAHPGHHPLVEQRFPHGSSLAARSEGRDPCRGLELRIEEIGAQRCHPWVGSQLTLSAEGQPGTAELRRFGGGTRQDDPGPPTWTPPLGPELVNLPRPAHSQMAVQDQIGLEMEQQVLALRLGCLEERAAQFAEPGSLAPEWAPRVRDSRIQHALTCQRRLQASRGAMNRVPLGHYAEAMWRRTIVRAT